MFCKNCGSQISGDSKFCAKCGTKLVEEKPIEPLRDKASNKPDINVNSANDSKPANAEDIDSICINGNDELLRALIGQNANYYLQQFDKIKHGERSFNWCACLFGAILTLYRKQYSFFMKVFLPAFILPFIVYIINFCLYAFARPVTNFGYLIALNAIISIYSLAASVFCGISFNKSYMKRLCEVIDTNHLAKMENQVFVNKIKPSASIPIAISLIYIVLILVLQAVSPSNEQLAQADSIAINGTNGMKTSASNDSGDGYIKIVKGSTPSPYVYIDTNKTYGEAFEDFFSSTKWEYLGGGTLEHFLDYQAEVYHAVNFTGKATADGEEVTVQCRFEAYENGAGAALISCFVNNNRLSEGDVYKLLGVIFDYNNSAMFSSSGNNENSTDPIQSQMKYSGFKAVNFLDASFAQVYYLMPFVFDGEVTFEEILNEGDEGPSELSLWVYVDGTPTIAFTTYNTDGTNDERYIGYIVVINPKMGLPLNDDLESDATIEDIERLADAKNLDADIRNPDDDFMKRAYISYGMNEYAMRFTYNYNSYAMEVELFTGRF